MRVFVTGASGWIGSAVVPELIDAGHQVVGLARSDAAAEALTAAGAEVVRGSLDDLDVLRAAAAASDGVIHLAFKHDLAFGGDFPAAAAADRRAIETFGEALADSDRPFVIASGVFGLPQGRAATETDGYAFDPDAPQLMHGVEARMANGQATLALASRGVRSSVVRLSPTVYGDGDQAFIPMMIGIAREKGVSGYLGDGSNRWPAVHQADAARLFRLALEKAPAGSTLHGVADEGVPIRAVAEVIGRHLGLPVAEIPAEDADAHFGWMAGIIGADCPVSSELTRGLVGWEPTRPGLLADLELGHYFRTPRG
ncbi:SDR family oxidoreductase [Kitasatospora mediocidica]|uniref:SDR family oxidoreductase n=1 Tax=Kitasatospora mediocidica TaxID=58352 RepID=UPI000562E41D|nr:SDR family oxidoreductase [Kitasatospora mediocidica]